MESSLPKQRNPATGRAVDRMEATRRKYEVEGFDNRTEALFHVTSPEAAKSIVNSGKMLPGSRGMFGGGIYFAQAFEIANHKALYHGATIEAVVDLGYSLICRKAEYDMTYTTLHNIYGCHSVKGDGCVSRPEYVVYKWNQVSISKVTIGSEVYYTAEAPAARRHQCANRLCFFYNQEHIGACRDLCSNQHCEFHGDYHLGGCWVQCVNAQCIEFEESHRAPCRLRCANTNCEDFGDYHSEGCKLKCQNERCENVGEFHAGDCRNKCTNVNCVSYDFHHLDSCKLICANQRCEDFGEYHNGPCCNTCDNPKCEQYGEYHKGKCLT